MIQRLGRYPGQPLRTIDHGPAGVLVGPADSLGGCVVAIAVGHRRRMVGPPRSPTLSPVPHVVAALDATGVTCSCGFHSGLDIEHEWKFHRAAMGLTSP